MSYGSRKSQIDRIILQAILVLSLVVLTYAIFLYDKGLDLSWLSDMLYGLVATLLSIIAIIAAAAALFFYMKFRNIVNNKIEALSSAIFDIVREVENCSASGWKNAVKLDSDLTARFAIDGPEKIVGASKLIATYNGLDPVDTLNATGEKMTEYQRTRRLSFLKGRGQLRRAISMLIKLISMRNFNSAYRDAVYYMDDQTKDPGRSMPNFPFMKVFFDLPDFWPSEGDVSLAKERTLSKWDEFVISRALSRGRKRLDAALTFHPATPDGEMDVELSGKATLIAFRRFLHSSLEDLYEKSPGDFK